MSVHALSTMFDPADPAVRDRARELAGRLDGDSELEAGLRSILDDLAQGSRVVMMRVEDEVTPAQAAKLLGVTRQFVDRLCEDGVLPYRRLPESRHRRLRVQDVVALAEVREGAVAAHQPDGDRDQGEIDAAWNEEIARRVAEVVAGEVELVDGEETRRMARMMLASRRG